MRAVLVGLRGTSLALIKVWVLRLEAGGSQLWGLALSERMSGQQAVQAPLCQDTRPLALSGGGLEFICVWVGTNILFSSVEFNAALPFGSAHRGKPSGSRF